jgi:hypothetical protein
VNGKTVAYPTGGNLQEFLNYSGGELLPAPSKIKESVQIAQNTLAKRQAERLKSAADITAYKPLEAPEGSSLTGFNPQTGETTFGKISIPEPKGKDVEGLSAIANIKVGLMERISKIDEALKYERNPEARKPLEDNKNLLTDQVEEIDIVLDYYYQQYPGAKSSSSQGTTLPFATAVATGKDSTGKPLVDNLTDNQKKALISMSEWKAKGHGFDDWWASNKDAPELKGQDKELLRSKW